MLIPATNLLGGVNRALLLPREIFLLALRRRHFSESAKRHSTFARKKKRCVSGSWSYFEPGASPRPKNVQQKDDKFGFFSFSFFSCVCEVRRDYLREKPLAQQLRELILRSEGQSPKDPFPYDISFSSECQVLGKHISGEEEARHLIQLRNGARSKLGGRWKKTDRPSFPSFPCFVFLPSTPSDV